MIFNYGTELVGINCHEKLGSTSIKMTTDYGLKKYEEDVIRYHYRNKKYVVVVRDVIKRWKSGYIQDMIGAFVNTDNEWKKHNVVSKNNVFWKILMNVKVDSFNINSEVWKGNPNVLLHGLDTMTKIHQLDKNYNWMCSGGHSKFYTWTAGQHALSELIGLENVYFVELKDLSSIEFKDWLCKHDIEFKKVKLEHSNKKSKFLEQNIDLFWDEYLSRKIRQNYRMDDISKLVCPFYEQINHVFEPYHELCKSSQATLEYIRKNHERYIKC